jgi:two-component system CheB/CheR fusion protein
MAEKVLNVIATDVGRPLTDINTNLNVPHLPRLMAEVVESLTILEQEVQDRQGHWYSMRLRPYKTSENKIDGVVLTLIDIDPMRRTIAELEEARDFANAVIESAREPMVALDAGLVIQMANQSFYRLFKTTRERARGSSFFDVINEPERLEALRTTLSGILPRGASLTNHEVRIDLPGTGPTLLAINVHQISSSVRSYPLILLSLRPL